VADLVEPETLKTWLGLDEVDVDRAQLAVRVAAGWVRRVTGPAPWPTDLPEDLFSALLELAGLAYDNPTSMSQRGTGEISDGWVITRRAEILDGVRASWSTQAAPTGSFPPAPMWPT